MLEYGLGVVIVAAVRGNVLVLVLGLRLVFPRICSKDRTGYG